jgi:hypothetical protein
VKGVHRMTVDQLQSIYRLNKGIYFLQMDFGNRKLVQKLVVDF